MTVKGVLFDFSGTLFRIESAVSWLTAALERTGIRMSEAEAAGAARRLEDAGALPGGPHPRSVPPHLTGVWAARDRSAEEHRAAYTGLAREVPLPRPEIYDALYERHLEPAAWRPYADAAGVLGELRQMGVRTAVVSNVGWDLRPVFRAHGLDAFVDAYVLSFEHGVQKPDPRLFLTACEALGLTPGEALMVGDDRRADGGAAALGCAVHLVDHLPVEERPAGLRPVLGLVG
ncbi:hydrolase [Streptosporangium nondiastaticum]|uniref:Hydrolase n=1 Tax=Streptosporangium nondiastaticum TaxID=35764 RepID=A0A9X7PHA3_9ACTN|nr:HAD-IA family hydrolase [Streptosporangium nondiastaticum]PSJ27940.1 hydrolase [Streptosporangium nondiastaticum]